MNSAQTHTHTHTHTHTIICTHQILHQRAHNTCYMRHDPACAHRAVSTQSNCVGQHKNSKYDLTIKHVFATTKTTKTTTTTTTKTYAAALPSPRPPGPTPPTEKTLTLRGCKTAKVNAFDPLRRRPILDRPAHIHRHVHIQSITACTVVNCENAVVRLKFACRQLQNGVVQAHLEHEILYLEPTLSRHIYPDKPLKTARNDFVCMATIYQHNRDAKKSRASHLKKRGSTNTVTAPHSNGVLAPDGSLSMLATQKPPASNSSSLPGCASHHTRELKRDMAFFETLKRNTFFQKMFQGY
jgi:hypothetical protein